jgi:hypothetical protein
MVARIAGGTLQQTTVILVALIALGSALISDVDAEPGFWIGGTNNDKYLGGRTYPVGQDPDGALYGSSFSNGSWCPNSCYYDPYLELISFRGYNNSGGWHYIDGTDYTCGRGGTFYCN